MTQNDFETILSGKTKLIKLNLNNLVLTSNTNGELDATTYNTVINRVLSNLISLISLSLNGLSNVTTVDFAQYTTKLQQLDLRGTGITNLTKLNTYATKCGTLAIDNDGINLLDIEDLFNVSTSSLRDTAVMGYWCYGIQLCSQGLVNQTNKLTRVTKYEIYRCDGATIPTTGWDFSNCSTMETLYLQEVRGTTMKLPSNLKNIKLWNSYLTISNKSSLTNIDFLYSNAYYDESVALANSLTSLKRLEFYWIGKFKLTDLTNPEKYTEICKHLYAGDMNRNDCNDESLEGIGNFTNLEVLSIYYQHKLTKLPEEIKQCQKLKKIQLTDTDISSLEPIKDLPNLEYLNLTNCPVFETGFYTKKDGTVVSADNMEIIANLHSKKLTEIYLSGTSITDFSKISSLTWTGKSGF